MAIGNNPLIRKLVLGAQLSGLLGGSAVLAQQPQAQAQVQAQSPDDDQDKIKEKLLEVLKAGDFEFAKKLIEKGAPITEELDSEAYPITIAAYKGDKEFTEWLIKKHEERGDKEFLAEARPMLISYAALGGQTEYAKWLIEAGANVNIDDGNGNTPLSYAAKMNQIEMMQFLIDHGASVNGVANSRDITPLYSAISDNNTAMAKWLIEHGANPNGIGVRSRPFQAAMDIGNEEVALLLLSKSAEAQFYESKDTPYHKAIDMKSVALIDAIAKSPTAADINKMSERGWTPLGYALLIQDFESARALMKHGPNIHLVNSRGEGALEAMFYTYSSRGDAPKRQDFIRELTSAGLDINAKSKSGNSAIASAVYSHDVDSMKTLMSLGANITNVGGDGSSLLHHILSIRRDNVPDQYRQSWPDLIREVIQRDPQIVNQKNNKGETPVHWAAASGDILNVDILRQAGADINARDNLGQTALHHTARAISPSPASRTVMAAFLSGLGADKYAQDNEGYSAYVKIAGKDVFAPVPMAPGSAYGGPAKPIQRTGKLPEKGIDPLNDRDFVGDQVEAIMRFGKDGRPAFYNRWPAGTPKEAMTDININIIKKPEFVSKKLADEMPKMTCEVSLENATAEKKMVSCLNGQKVEQALVAVDDDYVAMVRRYAQDFEKTYGIRVHVSENSARSDMPNIELFGYKGGAAELAAFAEMPPFTAGEGKFTDGYIMINTDSRSYLKDGKADKLEREHVLGHEGKHTILGFYHFHDQEAESKLTLKNHNNHQDFRQSPLDPISYAHHHLTLPDGVLDRKLPTGGVMGGFARAFMPIKPPRFPNVGEHNLTLVADTYRTLNSSEMLPAFSVRHDGRARKLDGIKPSSNRKNKARWNMELDANAGYCGTSEWQAYDPNTKMHSATINKLPVCIIEGDIDEIQTHDGNDKVTLTRGKDQFLDMGKGLNQARLFYREVGNKVIQTSGGFDELYIDQSVLQGRKIVPKVEKSMFVLALVNQDGTHGGSITLPNQLKGQGKGIEMLNIINEDGSLTRYPVGGLRTVQEWRAKVTLPLNTHFMQDQSKAAASPKAENHDVVAPPANGLAQKHIAQKAAQDKSNHR